MTVVDVQTIPGVELVRVGTWEISTGEWTVTPADLDSAVRAHQAGVLSKPVLKIGHEDPRFDGGPALGYVDNLRLTDGGATLVGDLVNVPGSVAAVLPYAYPQRSVEALQHYVGADGRTWPLVLTGLALLGATAPGIDTLAGIAQLYGLAASSRVSSLSRADDDGASARRRKVAVSVAAARRRRAHRTLITQKG